MTELEMQLHTELKHVIKTLVKVTKKLTIAESGLIAIKDSTDPMGIALETLTQIDAIDGE